VRRALPLLFLATVVLPAAQIDLDPRALTEAIAIGQASFDNERARFHRPYQFSIARPPLDSVDIVTPFRRVVIAAELRARSGDRRFGQRDGFAVAQRYPGQVSVHAELTFHPLNTLVLVPRYSIQWVTTNGRRVEPTLVDSVARYFPRTGDAALPAPPSATGVTPPALPGRSQPMLGATVVAFFDGGNLQKPEDPARELVIEEAGQMLARLPIELAKLR
jgi:hypothetical protein